MAPSSKQSDAVDHETKQSHSLLTLGQYLQSERQKKNISLKEVSDATGILVKSLESLEADARKDLPAEVFVRGFIKLYAKYLNLDPQYALNLYLQHADRDSYSDAELTETREILSHESLAESPHFINWRKALAALGLAVLIVLGFIGFRAYNNMLLKEKAAYEAQDNSTAVPQESENIPQATIDREIEQRLEQREMPEVGEEPAGQMEYSGTEFNAATDVSAVDTPEENQPVVLKQEEINRIVTTPAPAAVASENISQTDMAVKYTLRAQFIEETWVSIEIDGKPPQESFFLPGSSHEWQARSGFDMRLGNADGIKLFLNEEPVQIPQGEGSVVHISLP